MSTNGLILEAPLNYISASRLKTWLRCPLSYKLRYIDGVITPSNSNLLLGRVVHRALERFYRYRARSITLYPEIVAEHIKGIWRGAVAEEMLTFTSPNEESQLQAQAIGLVTAYLASECLADEALPVAIEQRLEAPLIDPNTGEDLGIPLVGIVDLVTEDGCIVDFKTSARSSQSLDMVHEVQLSSYSYLYRYETGRAESGLEIRSLIKTKSPKVEVQRLEPRRDEHFARLFGVVRAYLDALEKNHFHVRPGFECSFCDFRETVCGR